MGRKTGIVERHLGRDQRKLREAVESPGAFRRHVVERFELDMAGHLARGVGRIEAIDSPDRRSARADSGPQLIESRSDWGDRADAGDGDPLLHDRGRPSGSKRGSRSSTMALIVASVLPAIASTKCGPMTRLATVLPTIGHAGANS